MSNSSDWGEMTEKRPADLGGGERESEREHPRVDSESLKERQRADFSLFFFVCGLLCPIKTFARHP